MKCHPDYKNLILRSSAGDGFVIVCRPKNRKKNLVRFFDKGDTWNAVHIKQAKKYKKDPQNLAMHLKPCFKNYEDPIALSIRDAIPYSNDNECFDNN